MYQTKFIDTMEEWINKIYDNKVLDPINSNDMGN